MGIERPHIQAVRDHDATEAELAAQRAVDHRRRERGGEPRIHRLEHLVRDHDRPHIL